MKTKNLLLCAALVLMNLSHKAQLYFKNNTNKPVWVAYAKWNDSKNQSHWFTTGWFKVEPGDNKELAAGVGLQDYCYFFAETANSEKMYEGDTELLVDRSSEKGFHIKNADKQYQKDANNNYTWVKFRKFTYDRDLFGTKVKQTIVLQY